MQSVVDQFPVDFVGEDHKVVFLDDGDEGFEVGFLHDAASRVVGEGDDDCFGFVGDCRFDFRGIEFEFVLDAALDRNGSGARQRHQGSVAHEAGLGDEDLVAGSAHGAERRVETFGRAYGDYDFACGVVVHADESVEIFGNRLAQVDETGVGGVLGLAVENALNTSAAEFFGGDEVGLADAERNAIFARCRDFEEFSDARGFHIPCHGIEFGLIIDHYFPPSELAVSFRRKVAADRDLYENSITN